MTSRCDKLTTDLIALLSTSASPFMTMPENISGIEIWLEVMSKYVLGDSRLSQTVS